MSAVISDIATAQGADGNRVKGPREVEAVERNWRADPADGSRPLKTIRKQMIESEWVLKSKIST